MYSKITFVNVLLYKKNITLNYGIEVKLNNENYSQVHDEIDNLVSLIPMFTIKTSYVSHFI